MSARQLFQNVLVSLPVQLKAIPGYSPDIDLSEDNFVEVLSHYTFREEYQCALARCHKWHKDGYVCVFESGAIGNVGHVCARKWIGSSFDIGLNRYQQEIARPQLHRPLQLQKPMRPSNFGNAMNFAKLHKISSGANEVFLVTFRRFGICSVLHKMELNIKSFTRRPK